MSMCPGESVVMCHCVDCVSLRDNECVNECLCGMNVYEIHGECICMKVCLCRSERVLFQQAYVRGV